MCFSILKQLIIVEVALPFERKVGLSLHDKRITCLQEMYNIKKPRTSVTLFGWIYLRMNLWIVFIG